MTFQGGYGWIAGVSKFHLDTYYIPFMIFCFAADSFEQVDFDALRRELAEYLWRRVIWCFCWEVWKSLSDSVAITKRFNLPLGLLALH